MLRNKLSLNPSQKAIAIFPIGQLGKLHFKVCCAKAEKLQIRAEDAKKQVLDTSKHGNNKQQVVF